MYRNLLCEHKSIKSSLIVVLIPAHNHKMNLCEVLSKWTYPGYSLLSSKHGNKMQIAKAALFDINVTPGMVQEYGESKSILEIYISNSFTLIWRQEQNIQY